MRKATTFVVGLVLAGLYAASAIAPAAAQSQRAEPWFRACGIEMVRRNMDQLQATFICSCIIGGVMVSSQLNDQQKAMIIRSPSFRPRAATGAIGEAVGQYVQRIYNGCRKRLAAATGRPVARPAYTLSRAGWMHRDCMQGIAPRVPQGKAQPICDCLLRGVRDSGRIDHETKKILLSPDSRKPTTSTNRIVALAVNAIMQKCAKQVAKQGR